MTPTQSMQKFRPIKVMDVELSQPLTDIEHLDGYQALRALVRLHGIPLGYVQLGVTNGRCRATVLGRAILEQHSWSIIRHLICDGLASPLRKRELRVDELYEVAHPQFAGPFPVVTVAVCTRNRLSDLAICLDALLQLDYPAVDILVVDNAPSNDETRQLVLANYPNVRYVCEFRPGLSWARNRAIREARGEIIAFTDDDVIVDQGWVSALAQIFVENPEVMGVTGLVVPYELETEPQLLFEKHGGFERGFERKWFQIDQEQAEPAIFHLGAGEFGTGANMAYRVSLFSQIGDFDPALGVGTVTNGGEDIDLFFRVIQEGFTLVYEPGALVRHRHRRDYASLKRQLGNNGIGLASYHLRAALNYPSQRFAFIKLHIWWLWQWHIKRLLRSLTRPYHFPRELIVAELKGYLWGTTRYLQAKRNAATLARTLSSVRPEGLATTTTPSQVEKEKSTRYEQHAEVIGRQSSEHVSV